MDIHEERATQIYKRILHEVLEPVLGKTTTYSTDLLNMGKRVLGNKFKGVFASDKIPQLTDSQPYAILNLDTSTQTGSHWLSIAKIPNQRKIIMHDTFARKTKKIIPALLNSNNGKIVHADLSDKEQTVSEENCGAQALAFLCLFEYFGGYSVAKLI